jgi:hypothetical protein
VKFGGQLFHVLKAGFGGEYRAPRLARRDQVATAARAARNNVGAARSNVAAARSTLGAARTPVRPCGTQRNVCLQDQDEARPR